MSSLRTVLGVYRHLPRVRDVQLDEGDLVLPDRSQELLDELQI